MKTVLYFVLSIASIIYVAALCTINIVGLSAVLAWGTIGTIISGIASYAGLAIIILFAFTNFFGSPLKIAFFVILILVVIVYILTCTIPTFFQNLFGVKAWIGF